MTLSLPKNVYFTTENSSWRPFWSVRTLPHIQ